MVYNLFHSIIFIFYVSKFISIVANRMIILDLIALYRKTKEPDSMYQQIEQLILSLYLVQQYSALDGV